MADDNVGTGARPSWHEREITLALQRLANARANLAQLEEQAEQSPAVPERDPADLTRVDTLQREIERLTAKASNRFGAASARSKLEECQLQQRLVLERLGVATVDELHAPGRPSDPPAVDATVLEFARRECADAEKVFLEVAAMVIPDVESDVDDAEGAAVEAFDDELDLRIEPSAAS